MFFPTITGRLFEAREIGIQELDGWGKFPSFSDSQELWHPALICIRPFLKARSGFAYVVEDIAARSVVAYKITIFVSAAFASSARAFAEEHRAVQGLHELLTNSRCVIGADQIALDNSGAGLTAISLGAWDHDIKQPQRYNELGRILERCVIQAHAGFNLKQFLLYACSAEHAHYVEQGGAQLCGSSFGTAPYLLAVTGEQAPELYGRTVAALFDHHAPILSLSEPCRDLLMCALSGSTDEETARDLHVTVAAVKKRWQSVFEIAAEKLPHLCGESSRTGRRGPEKRTSILSYIRQHPEELRSTVPIRNKLKT